MELDMLMKPQYHYYFILLIDIESVEKCPDSVSLQSPSKSIVSVETAVISYDKIYFLHGEFSQIISRLPAFEV